MSIAFDDDTFRVQLVATGNIIFPLYWELTLYIHMMGYQFSDSPTIPQQTLYATN